MPPIRGSRWAGWSTRRRGGSSPTPPGSATRVHNPLTGTKDLQRLPGLVAIAYQHETSRCGDPHLHTHVIVPNRQARADGVLVSIDSKSLYHEAKAAGVIYQAVLRHELHAERVERRR
jgi:conjugative relaxase-like TrwC/TraI family protein